MAKQSAALTIDDTLTGLLSDVIEIGEPVETAIAPSSDRIILRLEELVEDANGEVVLFNDSHLASLAVATAGTAVERGEAGRHVTASGEDVSGFNYIAFDNGVRLYFPEGLDLVIIQDAVMA